ncbi:hypothetical protein ACLB2K_062436 [Fragaria x ananassa]
MLVELNSRMDGLATQQNIIDLTEQLVKRDRTLLETSHNKLANPAKQIELSSSLSGDEDFLLDEPMSKEEITLSINDKWPEVEADEIIDNNLISHGASQKNELEDRTEQSIFEAEVGSHTNDDGEPQVRMKGDPGANFPMQDVYVDTEKSVAAELSDQFIPTAKPNCQEFCGDVSIPYPFGIGPDKDCYFNNWYQIDCNEFTKYKPVLKLTGLEVLRISIDGTLRVNNPVTFFGLKEKESLLVPNLNGSPFVYELRQQIHCSELWLIYLCYQL